MAKIYGQGGQELVWSPISDELLICIAKIIRCFAEMEDILTLHLAKMSRIDEVALSVLLSGPSFLAKKDMAVMISKTIGGECEAATKKWFSNDAIETIRIARNTLAHGVYIGLIEGNPSFREMRNEGVDDGTILNRVSTYKVSKLQGMATYMESSLPVMEEELHVAQWRLDRRSESPEAHPKAAKAK